MNSKDMIKFLNRLKAQIPEDRVDDIFLLDAVLEGIQYNQKWNSYIIVGTFTLAIGFFIGLATGLM